MTVIELMCALTNFAPDTPVAVPGTGWQAGGYVHLDKVEGILLCPSVPGLDYGNPENFPDEIPVVNVVALN